MKKCSKCQEVLPVSAFQRNASKADGLQSQCRDCMNASNRASSAKHRDRRLARNKQYEAKNAEARRAYRAAWRAANANRIRAQNAAYRAANAEQIRAYNADYNERTREDRKAKYRANPEPAKARSREWQLKNADKVRERNRRWRDANPERFREYMRLGQARRRARKADLPNFDIAAKDLRRIYSSPCAVTGCTSTDIQFDHVIPIARGGAHGIGNGQPLCASHNQAKGARLWIEFRVYLALKERIAA